jgi:endonuclease/exonuclease/phosphatase family metal-dependent hydrolase
MLTVMTRNLFVGADLTPAYLALRDRDGLARLPRVVAEIFNPTPPLGLVQRSDFAVRAVALADEIEAALPDLIGLQEAAAWRARELSEDYLERLEVELARRGLQYDRVAVATNGDVELPSAAGGTVGLTDREAILVRADGQVRDVSNVRTGNFANRLPIRMAGGTSEFIRGWASVDARLQDATVRFITTHLEVASSRVAAAVQRLQADELLDGPAATSQPVVLVGDFNARPGTPTYERVRAAGFDDAWTRANPDGPSGFTCCHALPLGSRPKALRSRIDLIFTRGEIEAITANVVGDHDRHPPAGLIPSDHAGVVATVGQVRRRGR